MTITVRIFDLASYLKWMVRPKKIITGATLFPASKAKKLG
jgi:hypothetical protein